MDRARRLPSQLLGDSRSQTQDRNIEEDPVDMRDESQCMGTGLPIRDRQVRRTFFGLSLQTLPINVVLRSGGLINVEFG